MGSRKEDKLKQEIDPTAFALDKVMEAVAGLPVQVCPSKRVEGPLLFLGNLDILERAWAPFDVADVGHGKFHYSC